MAMTRSAQRPGNVPKLWEATAADHRRAVRDAVVDATWALVQEHGVRAVTMSQIAAAAGIGRATLYKYFPDVETILREHHRRRVAGYIAHLEALVEQAPDPARALDDVMTAYARISFHRAQHGEELLALLHTDDDVRAATSQVRLLFRNVIESATEVGGARGDISPAELADYTLHALAAAGHASDEAAVARLVAVTFDGLRG